MPSLFEAADSRVESIRKAVTDVVTKRAITANQLGLGFGGGVSGNSGMSMFANQAGQNTDQTRTQRQYNAFKNTVATALRPIMVRFASQPIRVGYTATRKEISERTWLSGIAEKAYSVEGEKMIREAAPSWIKASIGSNVTPLENHPLLDLLSSPNEFLTQNGLLQCTAASLSLTGRSAWWFDSSGDPRAETGLSTRIWYVPWHWLAPSGPSTNPFEKFKIQMPSAGEIEVEGEDIFYSMVPHPEDPSRSWSAVQSQAASVDTDENILMAQHTSMKNVIRPNLIITAGRMPGMNGGSRNGPRAALDRGARNVLIEAIKGHYQGVMKFGEPLILDAMIEDVRPLIAGPMELDLVNSSSVTQSRIMQGVGVSNVVAGYAENANRAGSTVAHEIFFDLVLNPLISLFGQSLNNMALRRYGSITGTKSRFKVWMDEAKPRDADATHQRVSLCMPAMKFGEVREYLRSGNLVLEERTDRDDEFMSASASEPVPVPVPAPPQQAPAPQEELV